MYYPRFTTPLSTDKNWIVTGSGGWNRCIEIASGSALPNCVGYAWGRWLELLHLGIDYAKLNLSRNSANVWWTYNDGYKRGQVPKQGAVACWQEVLTQGGSGHVCIVEEICSNGDIICSSSQSDDTVPFCKRIYYKAYAYTKGKNLYPSEYNLYYRAGSFQGFIYLPEKRSNFKWVLYTNKLRNGK